MKLNPASATALCLTLGLVFVFPSVSAHWATPGSPYVTHEHPVLLSEGSVVGYYGQRTCMMPNGDVIWSNPDGSCPSDSYPLAPPFRGNAIRGGKHCYDDSNTDGLNPGPGVNYAQSDYIKTDTERATGFTWPSDVIVDNGDINDAFASGSDLSSAHAGESGGRANNALNKWPFGGPGNGQQDSRSMGQPDATQRYIWTSLGTGPGQYSRTILRGNDMFDEGTSYGSMGPDRGYSTTRASRQDVQSSPGTDWGDHDLETGVGVACFTYAIDSGPNGLGADGTSKGISYTSAITSPWMDGCNGEYSTSYGCLPDYSQYSQVFCGAGADLNDPPESWKTLDLDGLSVEGVPHPIGHDGVYDTNQSAISPFGGCFNSNADHPGPSLMVGSGTGVSANDPLKGIKLAQPANVASLGPVSYTVCNDVAEQGCTNLPIETTVGLAGNKGHVFASLQQCIYDPTLNDKQLLTPPGGAFAALGAHEYHGQAAKWGSLTPKGQACWPERLMWSTSLNTWTPSSQSDYASWTPDRAPATGRDVEMIVAYLDAVNVRPLGGTRICDPGSIVLGLWNCIPQGIGTGTYPGWLFGWAAVFV